MKLNPRTIIHDSFETGIFIKGLDGLLQLVGSVLILVVKPGLVNRLIDFLTTHELSTDPHDWVANHLANFGHHYNTQAQWFGAIYLFSHGLVKIFLVYNLWEKKLWAYPTAIIIFGLFGIYQVYRFTFTHSVGLMILTILDVAVIILTWLEYRRLKQAV